MEDCFDFSRMKTASNTEYRRRLEGLFRFRQPGQPRLMPRLSALFIKPQRWHLPFVRSSQPNCSSKKKISKPQFGFRKSDFMTSFYLFLKHCTRKIHESSVVTKRDRSWLQVSKIVIPKPASSLFLENYEIKSIMSCSWFHQHHLSHRNMQDRVTKNGSPTPWCTGASSTPSTYILQVLVGVLWRATHRLNMKCELRQGVQISTSTSWSNTSK